MEKSVKLSISVLILSTLISAQLVTAEEDEFDFIIYHAGTAGSVLARRLSENPEWKVLLLDGGGERSAEQDIPLNLVRLPLDCTKSFGFKYEQSDDYCLAMKNNQCLVQLAKNFGGQSLIGDMIYTRGNRKDYDNLCRHGNQGWCFKDVLPFFQKVEDNKIPGHKGKNCKKGGLVTISYANYRTELASVFLKAGKELHYPLVNYNGKHQYGFSLPQTTIKDGLRQNAYSVYVEPIIDHRPNLVIRKNAVFTNLIFAKEHHKCSKVIGLEYKQLGFAHTVTAKREVILADSPVFIAQQLMLSGIGPAEHLKNLNITVIKDLPVGYNYHEVVAVAGLTFFSDVEVPDLEAEFSSSNLLSFSKNRNGSLSAPDIEALAFLKSSKQCHDHPDFDLSIRAGSLISQPALVQMLNVDEDVFNEHFGGIMSRKANAFNIYPTVLRPKSRGRVWLKSANPTDPPIIEGNFYSNPQDMKIVLKAIKTILKLVETKAFKKINTTFYDKLFTPCAHLTKRQRCHADDDEYWECYARQWTALLERWAGTTKMGPKCDKTTVVDAKLRVHGVKNLRIASPSVLPQQVSGSLAAFKYMLGEKLADMIVRCHSKRGSQERNDVSHESRHHSRETSGESGGYSQESEDHREGREN